MKYLNNISAIRVICTLAVIGIHVTSNYVMENSIAYLLNQIFRFAVPVFILISGVSTHYSELYKPKPILRFYYTRFTKIVVPYFIWTFIYMLYDNRESLFNVISANFWHEYFTYLLLGYDHLYFIIIILQLYILYPLLKMGFNTSNKRLVLVVLSFLITIYFQIGNFLYVWGINILQHSDYYYLHFPTWLFFFVIRMYCAVKIYDGAVNLHQSISSIVFVCISLIASLFIVIYEGKIANSFSSSTKPSVMVYSLICFYAMMIMYNHIDKLSRLTSAVKWFSDQSFTIYLCHILVMRLVRLTAETTKLISLDGTRGMVKLFVFTVLFSTIMAYVLSSIARFYRYLVWLGKNGRPSNTKVLVEN